MRSPACSRLENAIFHLIFTQPMGSNKSQPSTSALARTRKVFAFAICTVLDFRASLLGFGSLAALENNKNLGDNVVVDTSGRESLAHNMEGKRSSGGGGGGGSMKRKESVGRIKAGVSRMINSLSRGRYVRNLICCAGWV